MGTHHDGKVGIEWDWTSPDSASLKAPKGGLSLRGCPTEKCRKFRESEGV